MHIDLAIAATDLTLALYGAACLHLLLYRKDGARHRRHVSWLAWALLVVLAGSAIELAMGAHQVGVFEAMRAFLLYLFIFGARGNVARLLYGANDK
jgi:hypothetical protein